MYHYLFELTVWVLLAVLIGCIIGYVARRFFGSEREEVLLEQSNVITPASSLAVVKPVDTEIKTPEEVAVEAKREELAEPLAVLEAAQLPKTATPTVTEAFAGQEKKIPENNSEAPAVKATKPQVSAKVKPAEKLAAKPDPKASTTAPGKMTKPRGLNAPRKGSADDLQRISGIGPKNEKILNELGFFHYDQLANWTPEQVAWVDDHLRFNGRIARERWTKQAQLLAEGKETEFRKLYGTGGKKTTGGKAAPGSRTSKR